MIQRYNPGNVCGGEYRCDMVPDLHGDFVDYEDYERLEEENRELREAINRLESER